MVLIPDSFSARQEAEWVDRMVADLERRRNRTRGRSDEDLAGRARMLSRRYLEGRATPATVRWVTNQSTRWGSCTPADRSIRLSHQLKEMPDWVVDYVLVHELTHLLVPGHDEEFWAWVGRYPESERARGFLQGWASHAGSPVREESD